LPVVVEATTAITAATATMPPPQHAAGFDLALLGTRPACRCQRAISGEGTETVIAHRHKGSTNRGACHSPH